MTNRPKLLYVMGTARSGSTILEILLATGAHCVGTGELASIVRDGFLANKTCSCGNPFDKCGFWSKVRARLSLSDEQIKEWAALQKRIDWHTGFIAQVLRLVPRHELNRYLQFNSNLLSAIRETSGADVIIDSSKFAGRALALSRLSDFELCVICLTRSPEGLMSSFRKPNRDEQRPKAPWAVFVYYAAVIVLLRVASILLRKRILFLRYEDLVGDGRSSLERIGQTFGVDLSAPIERIRTNDDFEVGHIVTGNRLRKEGRVRFMAAGGAKRVSTEKHWLQVGLMKVAGRLLGFH